MNALQLSAAMTARASAHWQEPPRRKPVAHNDNCGRRLFTDADVRALLATGISQAEAARRLGVTPAAVCLRIKRRGWR
jgi:transcriptional regulator with GAF, ATPase, and Fis domain